MPWNVKRNGSVLFDVVERHVGRGLDGAIVPEHLPGAPPIDKVLLKRFRDELTVSGVELLEPALV